MSAHLPGYDWSRSYEWNYEHAPDPVEVEVAPVPGRWEFCGSRVDSPLGIPAGPLLNGRWCLYYASLGFDVLTYKTVRSSCRKCYEMPNLQPVECGRLVGGERNIPATATMGGSWAVSFGMPSRDPETWCADVERTRRQLAPGKLLAVSVVGTVEPGWTIDDLADDYARCAKWAVESGADAIETNFSCPNVSTCDGQLYQIPDQAAIVASRVRASIGNTPYVIKIGHVGSPDEAGHLIEALEDLADGLAMTNSIAATVRDQNAEPMFSGQPRGICGSAIFHESLRQVSRFASIIGERSGSLQIVAVGGVSSAADVVRYCDTGARAVQIATAAMRHPRIGLEIRQKLGESAFPAA